MNVYESDIEELISKLDIFCLQILYNCMVNKLWLACLVYYDPCSAVLTHSNIWKLFTAIVQSNLSILYLD